jgi:hypothetical protein
LASWRVISRPLSPGISRSNTTTFGRQRRIHCRADLPSAAVDTTSNSVATTETILAKNAVLSSATTMRSFIQLQDFAITEHQLELRNKHLQRGRADSGAIITQIAENGEGGGTGAPCLLNSSSGRIGMPCNSSDLTGALEQTSSGRRPEIGQQTERDCQFTFRRTLKA